MAPLHVRAWAHVMQKPSDIIDTEEETVLEQDGPMVCAGIFGDMDPEAIADKFKREQELKKRVKYHLVVPCESCTNCLEVRRFKPDGKYCTVGWYCLYGEYSVEAFGTCNMSHMRARGRHRVIYDASNAPPGFAEGLVPVFPKRYSTKKSHDKEERQYSRDSYRGGTSGYVRPDLDMESVNSGKIPKGLGN